MPKNVKNTTFPNLLDLIAPHSCRGCGHIGSVLCDSCKKYIIKNSQHLCPFCKTTINYCNCKNHTSFPPIHIISWRNSIIGTLLQDLKYHSVHSAAAPLADILYHTIHLSYSHLYIVPLPTIGPHIRKRGLDHTLLIAKHLAKHFSPNATVAQLLIRANSATQVGSTRQERHKQAESAYKISPKIKVEKNATCLLLDDVWTTGSSMTAATKILQQNGFTNLSIAILSLSE